MNYHQSPEDIIKAATPEQRLLWNYIFLTFGDHVSIQQMYKSGRLSTDTDLTTYVARKMFLIYDGGFSGSGAAGIQPVVPNAPTLTLFDETDTLKGYISNNAYYWDTAAAAYKSAPNFVNFKNQLFSRIQCTGIEYGYLIGYRLIY